jgi:hypothetical protein
MGLSLKLCYPYGEGITCVCDGAGRIYKCFPELGKENYGFNCRLYIRLKSQGHTVYRVPCFLSCRPNKAPPRPQASVAPPFLGPMGETHSLGGEGVRGTNSDKGIDTLVLYV